METILIVLVVLLLAVNGFVVWQLLKPRPEKSDSSESFLLMQQQLQDLTKTMDTRLGQTTDKMYDSLKDQSTRSQQLVREISQEMNEQLRHVIKGVTEVGESSKQVFQVADQLKELQNILKNPKQRGVLGEYYLETVLTNVLPPESFQMQYAFPDGEIVDAAVFKSNL